MKGYRFYAEYPIGVSKRRPATDATNVVAVLLDDNGRVEWTPYPRSDGRQQLRAECIAALFDHPDSARASSISREFLQKRCKRVPERTARAIHPSLFKWLDSWR